MENSAPFRKSEGWSERYHRRNHCVSRQMGRWDEMSRATGTEDYAHQFPDPMMVTLCLLSSWPLGPRDCEAVMMKRVRRGTETCVWLSRSGDREAAVEQRVGINAEAGVRRGKYKTDREE